MVISYVRKFLFEKGLLEVEVPLPKTIPGDAAIRPFGTDEHNQHISPELYLKELILVGLEAVFKIENQSRDKGNLLLQNPELTTCEINVPHAECNDLMEMFELMLSGMVKELNGSYIIKFHPDSQANHLIEIDFSPPFRRIDMIKELEKSANLSIPEDLDSNEAKECLLDACTRHDVQCAFPQTTGRLLDKLVSHFLVETCVKPTFLQHHPKQSLEAKSKQSRAEHVALFINKRKVCDTYMGLNNPAALKTLPLLKDHVGFGVRNDLDMKFQTILSCGLPPTAVGTLNVDTFSMIMTNEIHSQPVHHKTSTHKHFELLSNHKFRWEIVNDVRILQPPIEQEENMCAFAALAKQLDYQLRLLYLTANKGFSLEQDCCLFYHIKWRTKLQNDYPKRTTRWKPGELLQEAHTHGVPLWNGGLHIIQSIGFMNFSENGFFDELKCLLNSHPVVGVVPVYSTYSENGGDVYVERGQHLSGKDNSPLHHAVVLIDFVECDGVLYVAYQNSHGDSKKTMSKLGVSWLEATLIVEQHYGCSLTPVHPPNVLQTKSQIAKTLKYIEKVSEGSETYKGFVEEGHKTIEYLRLSHDPNSEKFQAWYKKVEGLIKKLHHISECMATFADRFLGVNDETVAGIKGVPKLLDACNQRTTVKNHAEALEVLLEEVVPYKT